jgi:hypothetical protein
VSSAAIPADVADAALILKCHICTIWAMLDVACRHTGRFLVLWLTCLPFVIWQELGWFSVPISMIVSFLLFGIEEIGVQIEVSAPSVPALGCLQRCWCCRCCICM